MPTVSMIFRCMIMLIITYQNDFGSSTGLGHHVVLGIFASYMAFSSAEHPRYASNRVHHMSNLLPLMLDETIYANSEGCSNISRCQEQASIFMLKSPSIPKWVPHSMRRKYSPPHHAKNVRTQIKGKLIGILAYPAVRW